MKYFTNSRIFYETTQHKLHVVLDNIRTNSLH